MSYQTVTPLQRRHLSSSSTENWWSSTDLGRAWSIPVNLNSQFIIVVSLSHEILNISYLQHHKTECFALLEAAQSIPVNPQLVLILKPMMRGICAFSTGPQPIVSSQNPWGAAWSFFYCQTYQLLALPIFINGSRLESDFTVPPACTVQSSPRLSLWSSVHLYYREDNGKSAGYSMISNI